MTLVVAVLVLHLHSHLALGVQQRIDAIEGLKNAEGFEPSKLAQINEVMQTGLDKGKLAGCSALVFKDGKEVFFNACGYQDLENKIPMSRDTIFRIYSMTKPITSVAVMQLVEQGKIDLDDPVSKHLPEFAKLRVAEGTTDDGEIETVDANREMTVRDLLRHTSGLSYGFFGRTPVDQIYVKRGVLITDRTLEETVTKLGTIPLKHQPGTRFEYGASTDVLGRLIEVVSGQSFDQYLKERLFDPLEMQDTFFTVPKSKLDRLAVMYRDASGGKLTPAPARSSYRFTSARNRFYSGGGGLCSTIDDYLNFSKMLLNEGRFKNKQIIKKSTLEAMFTNQLDSIKSPPRGFQFGLGFAIAKRNKGTDYSWGGIAGTRFWVNPELKMVSLFMIQINPYGRRSFGKQIRDIAYDAVKE